MRIAIVAASLDLLGGQGVQAASVSRALARDGHRVDFVPINPCFPVALRRLRRVPWLRTLLNEALYLPLLARLADSDVVHVLSAAYWSFLLAAAPAVAAGRLLQKRVILNYHSGEADDHLARHRLIVQPFLEMAHEIVVPSEFLREVFRRRGWRATVIPNVVDVERFAYRERTSFRPRLLSCRNLESHYRVDLVIEAFRIVRRRHPEAILTVIGTGQEREGLERLAAPEGGAVHFVGRVEPAEMPRYFDAADVLLNASEVDNQPLTLLEAFAAGLPVVTTPPGDVPRMVRHGETGFLAAPGDPESLARGVCDMVLDPSRACEMARRARQLAEERSWPQVRDAWSHAYGA
jgi:L-malate glycosyltransferase